MNTTHEDHRKRQAFDAFFTVMLASLKPHVLAEENGDLKPPVVREYVSEPLIEFVSWS
jgi:hypothetical protein